MHRQHHLISFRRIIHRLILIPKPQQFLFSVPPTDIHAERNQLLIHYIPERIRLFRIGCALDGNGPLVIGIRGRTPGAVLLLHIQADPSVLVNAIIAGCFCGRLGEPFSKPLRTALPHHTVGRNAVNAVRPLPGVVGA